MVYRIYVEKKGELAHEAAALLAELRNVVGITNLTSVRLFNRYDVDNIEEELFRRSVGTVFSEPQLDIVTEELSADGVIFAVEPLPGPSAEVRASASYEWNFNKPFGNEP